MSDAFRRHLISLREQVTVSVELAAQASREYHEVWSQRKGLATRLGSLEPEADGLENLRRREMLYLGEAAALQWILGRLDQLVAELEPGQTTDDRLMHERSREPGREPAEDARPDAAIVHD
ncbi:MAG TPA: hypothetical protein VFI42_20740 [Thermomicrobiaceae bacterium]|nr:hypothetical protein [Thermomicrobiaceae bacterium]